MKAPRRTALARTHRRLAALTAVLCCGVLALSLWGGWSMSCRQLRQTGEAAFTAQCSELCRRVSEGVVSDPWLSQWEAQNRYIAALLDNGTSPFFPGSWQPATPRETLLARAQQTIRENQGLLANGLWSTAPTFTVQGDGPDTYRAFAAGITMDKGQCIVLVLQDLADEQSRLLDSALWYAGCLAAGLLALTVISWAVTRRALAPVSRAMEQQSRFISAAGHELRTPVAAILASLDAMERCPEQAEEYRTAARAETARLGRLVEDLLILGSADSARWKWLPSRLDTDAIVIDAAEQLRGLAAQRGFSLSLDLPGTMLPPIYGDADRLVQLIAALVDNATSYAPAGTPVILRCRDVGGKVAISVIDHGPGVPDPDKTRIFSRFARGDNSRPANGHFGLGLAVAQELAALHGGRLACTDTPGGGATFTLYLPAAPI